VQQSDPNHRGLSGRLSLVAMLLLIGVLVGCEVDSYIDASEVGRFERTPTIVPILKQLDIIDEPESTPPGLTKVAAEDLIPQIQEYVLSEGDRLYVSIFELLMEGVTENQERRIDELGVIRLPVVGAVVAAGKTPSELEEYIGDILIRKGVLREPTVSVTILSQVRNTFSILAEPSAGGTAVGTYQIPQPDFRLTDAIAMVHGIPGSPKKIHVLRQVELYDLAEERVLAAPVDAFDESAADELPTEDPSALIQGLIEGIDQPTDEQPKEGPTAAPELLESAIDQPSDEGAWVSVDGRWVRTEPSAGAGVEQPAEEQRESDEQTITQRIIEIPYERLLKGEMRYNIVIRAGDIITVPPPNVGQVYVMGEVNRPGAYNLPGDSDLTLKQLVATAGDLRPLAIPERVDLIRRINADHEAWVRLNLRSIFHGTQPDVALKPDDQIIIGTNFVALPLQVARSGFRVSYGFGFILDRNFGPQVFAR